MKSLTHEQLLGYLLGALESKECVEVEQAMAQDAELSAELEKMKLSLGTVGLLGAPVQDDPPLCLAARTCEFVEQRVESSSAETVSLRASATVDRPKVTLSPVSRAEAQGSSLRKLDLFVACSVVLVGAALCFPLLFTNRFQANVNFCQNQLRQLGLALHEYSGMQPDGAFPHVPASGNRSVAGIYGPTLLSNKLVLDPRKFFCPGNAEFASAEQELPLVPTLAELDAAVEPSLSQLQETMGGTYGYSLGYTRDKNVLPPRNSRRAEYALLADAPHDLQPGRSSANHAGRGQNMLFEDGHVKFLKMNHSQMSESALDDPYHNRLGIVAAGVDINDAVLGRSNDRPMPVLLP